MKESNEIFGHCLERANLENFNKNNFESQMIDCAQKYIKATKYAFKRAVLPSNKYRAERFPAYQNN